MPHPPRLRPADPLQPPLPPCALRVAGGLCLRLKVVAGASRPALAGLLGDRLKVRVAAPAQDGRANAEVRALIGSWLGCRRVELLSGPASAEKTVFAAGVAALSPAQLAAAGLPCAVGGKE